jgi:spore coat polysaccharide biosynthesis protein SpsF
MPKRPHIAAVLQARMSSTRLPGKVMKPIVGQPLLWHILHRLKKSELIETICVATTSDPSDDALAAYAEAHGAVVVRGPEDDVLGRFALAAHVIDPDVVVRVCADAPLVDAGFVDFMIREMLHTQSDFVTLKDGVSAIHDGAECMSRVALDKLMVKAHDDPVAREHVSAYFKIHPEFVKTAYVDLPQKWAFTGARLSIDTPADVTFIEAIYERLHAQAGEATLTDLVALLQREPALLDLNAHVQQKSATQASGTVIMRCDAVQRSLDVARALRDRQGYGVRFAVQGDTAVIASVQGEGFAIDELPQGTKEIDWLLALAEQHRPVAMVLDVSTDLSATSVMRLRGADLIVAALEDTSARRLSVDAAFYAPMPQIFGMDWRGAESEPCVGWEYVVLAQDAAPRQLTTGGRKRVVVSLGQAEEHGLTLFAVRALLALGEDFDVTVVAPPGGDPALELEAAKFAPKLSLVRSTHDLPHLMAQADLALVGFGPAAYELGASGVPAVYLCREESDALSASAFEAAGMGVSLGVASRVDQALLAATVVELLADGECLRAMSAAGRMNLDGRGAMRIAQHVARLVEEREEALRVPGAQRQLRAV